MKLAPRLIVVLAVAALIAATGCSKGPNLSTPKDTAKSMVGALRDGNKAHFGQCFQANAEQREFLVDTMFDVMSKAAKLSTAIEKAYGAEGLKKFQEAAGSKQDGSSGKLDMPSNEELDKMEVKIEGDKAVCTMVGDSDPLPMVRVDGKWLIEIGENEVPPKGPERDQAVKMMKLFTGPIDQTLAKVGKSGETPETLANTFKTAMGQVMAEMMKEMMGEAMKNMTEKAE